MVPILILGTSLYIKSQISIEYVHDSEWKVIYTNDIDAKVKISLERDKNLLNIFDDVEKYLKLPLEVVAEEEMRNMHEYITNTAKGELTASKGNSEETKKIHLDKSNVITTKSNVITTGPLNNTSKITKVEYQPITGKRNTAFGHYGETEQADVDGEIRITIETNDENTKQLKALFGE